MSDEAAEYIALPDEGGVERSILRWLDEMPGDLGWTVYGLEPGSKGETEGAAYSTKNTSATSTTVTGQPYRSAASKRARPSRFSASRAAWRSRASYGH